MGEVGIFVPNLFLYAVVETAIRSKGKKPVKVENLAAAVPRVVVVDLDAAQVEDVHQSLRSGVQVLAFGSHQRHQAWLALRAAGAVVLPKSRFFRDLPLLLESVETNGR